MQNRKPIGSRNGLNIYTKLKTKKPINKLSSRQVKKNKILTDILQICIKRANYRCEIQGDDCLQTYALSGHHIQHRSQGGKHEVSNIIIGCPECHNHQKYTDGIPISREDAYRIIGVIT